MITVRLYFNFDHDAAVIEWDWRHGHSIPFDVVNAALAKLYNEKIQPWLYVWWDMDTGDQKGMLLTATLDLTWDEVNAMCSEIIDTNQKIQLQHGWEAQEYEIDA